jgi:hypothetical protein
MRLTSEQIQGVLELVPSAQVNRLHGPNPYIRIRYWDRINKTQLNELNIGLAKLGLKVDEIEDWDDDSGPLFWYSLK